MCSKSWAYTTPKISSSDFSYTGILENFFSTNFACNSSSEDSAATAMMSGRGVITSRTRLSLNSTTCSIKSRLLPLNNSFFFRRFHQRFNSLFSALLFGLLIFLLRNSRQ